MDDPSAGREANRIRDWRQVRRMTLSDVADATGYSRSEISKLELGLRELRLEHLVKLSQAFGVSADQLLSPAAAARLLGPLPQRATHQESAVPSEQDRVGIFGYVRDNKLHDLNSCSGYISARLPAGFARPAYVVYNPSPALTGVRVGDLLAVTTMFPPQQGDLSLIRHPDETGEVVVLDERPRGPAVAYKVVATFLK